MATGGDNLTMSSPGDSNTPAFMAEYFNNMMTGLKSFLKWSLVCDETAQKETNQMEQIIGPIGNDPTAPSDLHTVTETTMFNSVTIMAIIIITFCIFYFIDFITQLLGGVTSAVGLADTSISQAFIEPVAPRTKKRRKPGALSRESTTQESSSVSVPDPTQPTTTPSTNSSMSMKDILTRSIRPGTSALPETSPTDSLKQPVDVTQLKPYIPPNTTPDRKLAGRSPIVTGHTLVAREAGLMLSKDTQTTMDMDLNRDYCDTSSVEFLCYDQLDEFHMRPKCNNIYEENYGLPYADDFSGDEFGDFQYEQAKAYLEYMAQLDGIRTEFSIDDISDPDKLLDEWANVDSFDSQTDTTPGHIVTTSEDDFTESLYGQALDIFNRIKAKSDMDVLDDANCDEETRLISENSCNVNNVGVERSEGSSGTAETAKLLSLSDEDQSKGSEDDLQSTKADDEVFQLPTLLDSEIHAQYDVEDIEVPRELNLSNSQELSNSPGPLLSENDLSHSDGCPAAESDSVFTVKQSMTIRRYHHVVFTYPDPTPYKVFLTGSFFGWKMSLPMQREGNAFRLSITLPAGEHQYRFEVHRHPTTSTSDAPCILHE